MSDPEAYMQRATPLAASEPAAAPPSPAGAAAGGEREDTAEAAEAVRRQAKLLGESANVIERAHPSLFEMFKDLLSGLFRRLARLVEMLRGKSAAEPIRDAARDVQNAQNNAQLADAARKGGAAVGRLDNSDTRTANNSLSGKQLQALLQERAGLDEASALLYCATANASFKPAPDNLTILSAALEAQARTVQSLQKDFDEDLGLMRESLRIRTRDIHPSQIERMELKDMQKIVKAKAQQSPEMFDDLVALGQRLDATAGDLVEVRHAAEATFARAWEALLPMQSLQGAASRIWDADVLTTNIEALEKAQPEVARQRELLERQRLARGHGNQPAKSDQAAADAAPPAAAAGAGGAASAADDGVDIQAAAMASLTPEHLAALQARRERSAQVARHAAALDAAGQGRALNSDGKPMTEKEQALAQAQARDVIARARSASAEAVPSAASAPAPAAPVPAGLARLRDGVQAHLTDADRKRPMASDEFGFSPAESAHADRVVHSLAADAAKIILGVPAAPSDQSAPASPAHGAGGDGDDASPGADIPAPR